MLRDYLLTLVVHNCSSSFLIFKSIQALLCNFFSHCILLYIYNRMHIFCVVHNMKNFAELGNISCQSKYIPIDSFRNEISPRNRFSQPHMTLPPITENRLDGADGSFWKSICITPFLGGGPHRLLPARNISCWRL